jgi:peptide deformylase
MLLNISQMPQGIKLCKVLSADKIARKSTPIETFPKTKYDLDKFNQDASQPISEALESSMWRMVRACISDDGVGLAAPQIGIFKRMFVIRENGESFRVYIHPRYSVDISSQQVVAMEGCLSVPGKRIPVARASVICAEWLEFDTEGKMVVRTELLEGFKARVFQHEYDHLEGVSILDKARNAKSR